MMDVYRPNIVCSVDVPGQPVDRPTLDGEVLDELERIGGTTPLVHELFTLFLADAGSLVAELDDSLARSDGASLARAAHQFKGAAANVGASELAHLCSLVPTASQILDECAAASILIAIRRELDRVQSAIGERASVR